MVKFDLKRKKKPAKQYFILVRKGLVQRLMMDFEGRQVKSWPVTHTLEDANTLAHFLGMWDSGVRGSRIGVAPGETLEGHISMAIDEGCELAVHLEGWRWRTHLELL